MKEGKTIGPVLQLPDAATQQTNGKKITRQKFDAQQQQLHVLQQLHCNLTLRFDASQSRHSAAYTYVTYAHCAAQLLRGPAPDTTIRTANDSNRNIFAKINLLKDASQCPSSKRGLNILNVDRVTVYFWL